MPPLPDTHQGEAASASVPSDRGQAQESMYVDAFRGIIQHLYEPDASMGPEASIDLIRALEERIEGGEGDVIKLKRDRNSLLNISTRIPPEILGHIFYQNLVRESDWSFEGLQKGSYNFLLVCHHWFEIASRTPELWSFWGNTLQDWKKRYHRSRATPLDLVLDEDESDPDVLFDETLQNAVRSRVMQDTIRQIHLRSNCHDTLTLTSIISSLTPDGEGGQNENIESIVLENGGEVVVEVSNFFTRSRLLRLRFLDIYGNIWISSWDHLASRTTFLTFLSLNLDKSPFLPTITVAQLFSILTANPNLRKLSLSHAAIPNDADASTFKVQLCNLNALALTGKSRHIFPLLRRFIFREVLDDMWLSGSDSTVEDISQTLAPYMEDYFRRDARFQGRLGVHSSFSPSAIIISLGVVTTQTPIPVIEPPCVSLTTIVDYPPPAVLGQLFIGITALIPRERIVSFHAWFRAWPPEEVFLMMPNIETLYLSNLILSEGLLQPNPDGPHANRKLFPSLRSLFLEDVTFLIKDDWNHFITYLTHQTSGGQIISLEVVGEFPHDCPEIVEGIRGLVKEFTHRRNPAAEENE